MAFMKSRNIALKTSLYVTVILFISVSNAFIENFGQMGDQINSFVDGLYKNVDSWTDHVINHAKSEECHYICPNGKSPIQNESVELKLNGCATFGIQIKESDLPIKEMRHCCDDHQMCYHKCQSIKNECDNQFQRCLFKQCEKSSKDEVSLKGCKTASKLLLMGVLTFGCKSFKDSQAKACVCIGNDEL